jgi:metal-dependent membrane protease
MSKGVTPRSLRIATVLQDIMMFILPAVATAVMITRTPARFLMIDRKPKTALVMLVIATILAAVPAMNMIVSWNQQLTLPESMKEIESILRNSEAHAAELTSLIFGNWSTASYMVALLIVSVLAGVSEELYFRGGLQRILVTAPIGKHLAVWGTAIIFSAVHMQFFGFVPRMLLGAYFGYLCVWTECLWLPIIAHVLNNAMAATELWLSHSHGYDMMDKVGTTEGEWIYAAVSAVLTSYLLFLTYRTSQKQALEK